MGFVSSLFERRAVTPEMFGIRNSTGTASSGVMVSPHTALTSTSVFAAVRLLADTVAQLPLLTYQRRADGGKDRYSDHPVSRLLHLQPNPEMSSFRFRQTIFGHAGLWGNGYAEIEWKRGYPVALWPLRPDGTYVRRQNGALVYDTSILDVDGSYKTYRLPAYRVLHLRGFGNGYVGYSPIRLHMETIGLEMATRQFGSRFFGNGARPGVVLTHPGRLSDKAVDNMRNAWINAHEGLTNAHRVAILEEGVKLETVGIPPEEAQFLETRRYQLHDIARIYRIPPHLLQDLTQGGHNTVEQLSLEFVTYTLLPLLENFEQELMLSLLVESEIDSVIVEHLVDGLLRGDFKSRNEGYATGRQGGWLSVNDIRRMENLNPIENGDIYLTPLNMVEAGGKNPTPTKGSGKGNQTGKRQIQQVIEPVIAEAMDRLVRREAADLRRASPKLCKMSQEERQTWVNGFYGELSGVIRQLLVPTQRSLIAFDLDPREMWVERICRRYLDSSMADLRVALATDNPRMALEQMVGLWETNKAQNVANQALSAALGMESEGLT